MRYILGYFDGGTWNYKKCWSDKILHSQNDAMMFAKSQLTKLDKQDVFNRGEWNVELDTTPDKAKEALDGFLAKNI